jgi:ribonuclease HI
LLVTRYSLLLFMSKKKYYAVIKGRNPGIYDKWRGDGGAESQISEFPRAVYKGFSSREEAMQWFETGGKAIEKEPARECIENKGAEKDAAPVNGLPDVTIFTDGACRGNPGPGGYGVVMLYGKHRKELSGGFKRTTNNRMEIMGPIIGLSALKTRCKVTVCSDSRYVVNAVMLGWARRWKKNGWKRNSHDPALNADLWDQLLSLCDLHDCKFVWVAGHAGNTENERCDALSVQAATQKNLPPDKGYEELKSVTSKS